MSEEKVTYLRPDTEDVIRQLEELAERARRGEIKSIAIGFIDHEGDGDYCSAGEVDEQEALRMMGVLHRSLSRYDRIAASMLDPEDDTAEEN